MAACKETAPHSLAAFTAGLTLGVGATTACWRQTTEGLIRLE